MISKELFIRGATSIESLFNRNIKFLDKFNELFSCTKIDTFVDIGIDELVDFLSDAVGDKEEWLRYFMMEYAGSPFTSENLIVHVKTYTGIERDIENWSDVYDLIQEEKSICNE